jgi:small neutral amino acid transporter SnatA (MarC family)
MYNRHKEEEPLFSFVCVCVCVCLYVYLTLSSSKYFYESLDEILENNL